MSAATAALRPFLWLAAIAFLVGFVSYLAFGGYAPATAHAGQEPAGWPASVSGPVAPVGSAPVSDEWNTPKHI